MMNYYYIAHSEFFTPALAVRLSLESEWQQVSSTLLCVLANLNNGVVWIVLVHPLNSNSSSPLHKMYLPNPSAWTGYDTRSVWILSFSSLTSVVITRLKNQSALLFTHNWKDNSWIDSFPKGISIYIYISLRETKK